MKKVLLTCIASVTIAIASFAQAPEGFKYQAVVRDAGNLILNNQAVGMRMTIQQGSIGGTTVYQETFAPTTNAYGLVNLEIGSGTVVSGDFTTIDWANGPYFMETAADVTGGTSYVVMGTSQLMSVPFALYAKTAENTINDAVDDADNDPTNEIETWGTLSGIPAGFSDNVDNVDDADYDPANELNTSANLTGSTLNIIDAGGTQSVDLSSLNNSGTDDQNIIGSGLSGTTLTIGIEGGNPETVDLSSLVNDADWTIDGSGNMTNANTADVIINRDALINGITVGRGGGNIATNTVLGDSALYWNTEGNHNTATGGSSLYNNIDGNYNTANGYWALYNNTTGNYNTANGSFALYANIDGDWNTANGVLALASNTTGNYNTGLGNSANSIGSAYDNSTGVGYNADCNAANTVVVGNTSVTSIGGQVGWTTLSDARFKKNIRKDEVRGLEFITGLMPVTYNYDIRARENWKETNYGEKNDADWEGKYDIEQLRFSGFIAQDVEALAKEIGYDFSGVDAPKNDKDFYGLRYAEFVVPLVKGMQQQQEMIEQQQEQIEQQQELIQALSTELEQVKTHLNLQTKK